MGRLFPFTPKEDNIFLYDELTEAIQCVTIVIIELTDRRKMVVDEMGKLEFLVTVKEKATELYMKGRMNWNSWVNKMRAEFGD